MTIKVFTQRFNKELSLFDLPTDLAEKTKAVSKVFGVTRHMANALIFGHIMPSDEQIDSIARVLEVCPKWLSGKSDIKRAYSVRETVESE